MPTPAGLPDEQTYSSGVSLLVSPNPPSQVRGPRGGTGGALWRTAGAGPRTAGSVNNPS
jgi:hypothetical protein